MFSELPSATSTKIAQTFGDMVEQNYKIKPIEPQSAC